MFNLDTKTANQTRIQRECLTLIAQFCLKVPDLVNFVSSYLRELLICVLENMNVPADELSMCFQ